MLQEELNELVSGWSELLVMLAYHGPATAADLRRRLGRRLLDALAHRVHQPEPGPAASSSLRFSLFFFWQLVLISTR